MVRPNTTIAQIQRATGLQLPEGFDVQTAWVETKKNTDKKTTRETVDGLERKHRRE